MGQREDEDNPSRRCGQPWYFSPDQQAVTLARVSRRCRRESGSVPNEALFLWNNTLWHRANFSHRPSSTIQLKYKDPASRVRDLTQLPKEELQLVSPNLLFSQTPTQREALIGGFSHIPEIFLKASLQSSFKNPADGMKEATWTLYSNRLEKTWGPLYNLLGRCCGFHKRAD